MNEENPLSLQFVSTSENSSSNLFKSNGLWNPDSIRSLGDSNQSISIYSNLFPENVKSGINYDEDFLSKEKNNEKDTSLFQRDVFDNQDSKNEFKFDDQIQSSNFDNDIESFQKIFQSSNHNSFLKDEKSINDNLYTFKSEKNWENMDEINDENICDISEIKEDETEQKEKDEMKNDLKCFEKNDGLNDKSGNLQIKEISDKSLESNKKENSNSYNNELNNKKNIYFIATKYGSSNNNKNISSITKGSKKSRNLLNKKIKEALKSVEVSLNSKKKSDKIVVIIDGKTKLDFNKKDIKISEEFAKKFPEENEILINSIAQGNKIYFKKNEEEEYMVSFKNEKPNEAEEKLDEAINKKSNKVKEKIKEYQKDKKDKKKLYDIRRGIFREFKEYLEKNRQKYKDELSNDFWNDFFEQKEKDIELSSPIKGIKFNFPSFNHNLMKYLFIQKNISYLYEEFLKDEDFHKKYCEKNYIQFWGEDDFYRKNFHKIYCDNKDEDDIL